MDDLSNDVEVLSSERDSDFDSFVVRCGPWKVKELAVDAAKIDWLWSHVQKYPTLFSDLTSHNKAHLFIELLQDPNSYWLEIVDEVDKTIGIVYVTDLQRQIDAQFHLFFIDRELNTKGELVKAILEYLFNKFPGLHRLTASMPDIYFATKRLAIRSGFKSEGCTRESLLLGGRWRDEAHFGILAKEVLNGND